jgi:hypothetical protein
MEMKPGGIFTAPAMMALIAGIAVKRFCRSPRAAFAIIVPPACGRGMLTWFLETAVQTVVV